MCIYKYAHMHREGFSWVQEAVYLERWALGQAWLFLPHSCTLKSSTCSMESFTEGAEGNAEVWDRGWEAHWQESTAGASAPGCGAGRSECLSIPLQAPCSRGCEGLCHIPAPLPDHNCVGSPGAVVPLAFTARAVTSVQTSLHALESVRY